MLQTILLPGDDLSKHADSVHPVPLLDDAWLQDCESNGVVVMGQMNEEKSVACHLDHVQKDTYSVDDKEGKFPRLFDVFGWAESRLGTTYYHQNANQSVC